MDPRLLGSNLVARNKILVDRKPLEEPAEDAYYEQYAPAPVAGHVLRVASVVAAIWIGFEAIGFFLQ
jgi:hypothetical protein